MRTKEELDNFDITANVCDMHCERRYPENYKDVPQWSMYSFNRIAYTLLNAMGKELFKNGWTEEEIRVLFQSKNIRWSLDGDLGDKLESLGRKYATQFFEEHNQIKEWVKGGA